MKKTSKRKVNKKGTSKLELFKNFITNEKTLLGILIILAIIVLVLFIKILNVKKENSNKVAANIIIPIIEENQVIPFNIDAYNLAKNEEEYVIKVTNYSGSNIAKKDYNYKIEVSNYSNSDIIITKDNEKDNLISDNNIIEGTLKKRKKETTYYHVKIKENKGIKEKELIGIRVTS